MCERMFGSRKQYVRRNKIDKHELINTYTEEEIERREGRESFCANRTKWKKMKEKETHIRFVGGGDDRPNIKSTKIRN